MGFTKLENHVLDMLVRSSRSLTPTENAIIFYLLRYTAGFHKRAITITAKEVAEAIGLSQACNARRAMGSLAKKNIIIKSTDSSSNFIMLNTNVSEWEV